MLIYLLVNKGCVAVRPEYIRYGFPGQGEWCGKENWSHRGHGTGDGYVDLHNICLCHDSQCSKHFFYGWASNRASGILAKIDAYRERNPKAIVQSFILSAPPSIPLPRTRAEHRALQRLGADMAGQFFKGSILIFHHKRKGKGTTTGDSSPVGMHWHGFGDGFLNPKKVAAWSRLTGWVLKGEGKLQNEFARLRYELSHAATINPALGVASSALRASICVRWTGTFKGLKSSTTKPKTIKCGVCHQEIPVDQWDLFWFYGERPPPSKPWERVLESEVRLVEAKPLVRQGEIEEVYNDSRHLGWQHASPEEELEL